ncbi:hypothetical protein D8674_042633 [Pyrus ussuriensis x Pyrus communis]|uniref:Myb-like domain-containing protein n=1 Tax=Pyrus ussuriensis x Pyrus communis TaxID=2448454 RepID=A0A5N5I6R5_9ROSA|nr:hypothetical protein D8674_042633 [Pyrus ussuriensis x Pyrus communis]
MKCRTWTRKEDEALCRAYRWVLEDSVKGSSQTSGIWTRVSKKYYEFYKGTTTPPNTQNYERLFFKMEETSSSKFE